MRWLGEGHHDRRLLQLAPASQLGHESRLYQGPGSIGIRPQARVTLGYRTRCGWRRICIHSSASATLRYRAGGGRRRRQFDPRSPRSSCRTAAGAGRLRSDIHQRSSPAGGFRYNLVWDGRSDGASKIERHRVKKTNGQHCIIAYNSFKCHIYRIKTNRI